MPNYSKSPNKFLGSVGGRGGLLGAAAKVAKAANNVPSVVATAGASGMSGRIQGIESRLSALEGGGATAGAAQPATVAPSETFTDPLTGMEIQRGTAGNEISPEANVGAARARRDERAMLGAVQPQAPASEELGSLMASPFTVRQRSNMGPLKLNSPLNGNAFTAALQSAKASGASTFDVGGKTYNVK